MIRSVNQISRRSFIGSMAAIGAASMLPGCAFAPKGRSNFGGVQIGTITYSYRSMPKGAEAVLQHCVNSGLSSIELMGSTVESYAKGDLAKVKELRKMYEDAGVDIHIVKYGDIGNKNVSDERINYYFDVAKALGSPCITREVSEEAAKRLGPMVDKAGVKVAFHNHTQITQTTYDGPILGYGKNLMINLDIGHYVAANDDSVVKLIEKYQDRIYSIHLKDRKTKANGQGNMPFGEGNTPVIEALKFIQKNKLPIYADIELEYKIPENSDAVKEVARCAQYCKKPLV
ncbi:MAG: TIM barrel protein [Kiritimatiellae bacterium]|jgi:sugar phosphate isomerase/epimerase|nr:TIM barrel protein [Kiritimatiellia bacterium]